MKDSNVEYNEYSSKSKSDELEVISQNENKARYDGVLDDISEDNIIEEVIYESDISEKEYYSSVVPGVRPARINKTPRNSYIPESIERDIDVEAEQNRELNAAEDIYVSNEGPFVIMEVLDWLRYILLAVIIGLLLSRYVVQRSSVSGRSMMPTLKDSDQLLVDKISLKFSDINRGDIVTLDASDFDKHIFGDERLLVKRVIALPGDTLDFVNGKVIVNGEILNETYLSEGTLTHPPINWKGAITISENHYYVLGDNRENSSDSRIFGAVPRDSIDGKVWIRIYPFDKFGNLN